MLKSLLMLIPGANYAVVAYSFVTTYWRPLLLIAAVIVSFHEGVKHERKKGEAAQLRAKLEKVTFERDNLRTAGDLANKQIDELQARVNGNEKLIADLQAHPLNGDCAISPDAVRRLRAIGHH